MSKIVDMWAQHGGRSITPLLKQIGAGTGVMAAAVEKALHPHPDYAGAARAAGWHYEADESEWRRPNEEASDGYDYANGADTACRQDGNAVLMLSDIEHVVVSDWLGDELRKYGEKVYDLGGNKIWAKAEGVPVLEHVAIEEIAQGYDPEVAAAPGFR